MLVLGAGVSLDLGPSRIKLLPITPSSWGTESTGLGVSLSL